MGFRKKHRAVARRALGVETIPAPPTSCNGYIAVDESAKQVFIARERMHDPHIASYVQRIRNSRDTTNVKIEFVALGELTEKHGRGHVEPGETQMSDTAVLQIARRLFTDACARRASDVHILVHDGYAEVLFRIDGLLRKSGHDMQEAVAMRLCSAVYAEGEVGEASFTELHPISARLSRPGFMPKGVNALRIESRPKEPGHILMVFRLLYESSGVPADITDTRGVFRFLGYESTQIAAIERMLRRARGIVIIAGPTGGGKSTTLKYSMEAIARQRPELSIQTVEQPVEYRIKGVTQSAVTKADDRESRQKAYTNFLRSVLRSDPDIIMNGEIREAETARLVIEAGDTGHMVWSTLHSSSAWGIMRRMQGFLRDDGESDPMSRLAHPDAIIGMMYQVLVPTLCSHCAVPITEAGAEPPDYILDELRRAGVSEREMPGIRRQNPSGASCGTRACRGGISGRTVVAEVVEIDEELYRLMGERERGIEEARLYWERNFARAKIGAVGLAKTLSGHVDPVHMIGKIDHFSPLRSPANETGADERVVRLSRQGEGIRAEACSDGA